MYFSGCADWYDALPFDNDTRSKITETKNKITKNGKSVTHARMIAELTLGFWTSLITTRYSQSKFQSHVIKRCFKNCPPRSRSIKNLQETLNKMRHLRNRVSHYERIIHWKDLLAQHGQLLECIRWMDGTAHILAKEMDNFADVHAEGLSLFVALVKERWN